MPPAEDSPYIPPMPSPYGGQRGVMPSPLSNEESLPPEDEDPSHSRRRPPRGPYPAPYGPYTPQWGPAGQWGPPGSGYVHGLGLTPGPPQHLYPGTPAWGGYQPPYGPPPMYGYPQGRHPHSTPYSVGPLPSVASPYHGGPYHPHGYPGYMPGSVPGSVPTGPSQLYPEDIGYGFPDRPTDEIIRIDNWAVGAHYAPVLTPFQVAILDATLVVNPLLCPPGENPPADLAFLQYNVLLPVSRARRSVDPPNRSWSAGRQSPATSPRVSRLRIVSREFPWVLEIEAKRPKHGVTCVDVLEGIHEQLQELVPRGHVNSLTSAKGEAHKRKLFETYHYNRSTARDAPGGYLGEGVRRVDWLLNNVMFDGLVNDQKYVQDKLGISGPGWKGLKKGGGKDDKETSKDGGKDKGNLTEKLQGWPATLVLKLDQRYNELEMDTESITTDVTESTEVSQS